MRRFFLALLLLCSFEARAAGYADIWWNPSESGWGVTVSHQNANMFLTFFIYDSSNVAHWYSAGMTPGVVQANGLVAWTGQMVSTNGPYYGTVPFNPALVTGAAVGTVTFAPSSASSAFMTYTINGVSVTKTIVRETIGGIPLGGFYSGGYSIEAANCDGSVVGNYGSMTMAISTTPTSSTAGSVQALMTFDNTDTCSISGTYTQQGTIFNIAGVTGCATNFGIASSVGKISVFEFTGRGMDTDLMIAGPNACNLTVSVGTVEVN